MPRMRLQPPCEWPRRGKGRQTAIPVREEGVQRGRMLQAMGRADQGSPLTYTGPLLGQPCSPEGLLGSEETPQTGAR